jgi:hypothetical protein
MYQEMRTMRGTTVLLLEAASVPTEDAEVMLSILLYLVYGAVLTSLYVLPAKGLIECIL